MLLVVILIVLSGVGIVYVLSGESFFIVWLSAELVSLMVMMIIISNKHSMTQGGLMVNKMNVMMKYTLVQMTMSGVLFVIIMFKEFSVLSTTHGTSLIMSLLMLLVLCVKMSVFPGYIWVIDVFSSLSMLEGFLISVLPKFSLYVILFNFFDFTQMILSNILVVVGFLSVLLGSVLGGSYSDIRCIMGSSSIMSGGWLLVSLGGPHYWLFFLSFFYYLVVTFVLFFYLGTSYMSDKIVSVTQLGGGLLGVKKHGGSEAGIFNILLFSFVSVPCSLVFFFKLMMIMSGLEVSSMLVVCTMLGSTVGIIMYQRVSLVSWMCDSGGLFVWVESEIKGLYLGSLILLFSFLFTAMNFVLFFYYI